MIITYIFEESLTPSINELHLIDISSKNSTNKIHAIIHLRIKYIVIVYDVVFIVLLNFLFI